MDAKTLAKAMAIANLKRAERVLRRPPLLAWYELTTSRYQHCHWIWMASKFVRLLDCGIEGLLEVMKAPWICMFWNTRSYSDLLGSQLALYDPGDTLPIVVPENCGSPLTYGFSKGDQTQLDISPVQVLLHAFCWSLIQIRSSACLKRSVRDGMPRRCFRNMVVMPQNFNPAASAKTVQGTSIQRGLSLTLPSL